MDKLKDLISSDKRSDMAQSVNPCTGETLHSHKYISDEEIEQRIKQSWDCFEKFKRSDPKERAQKIRKLVEILKSNSDKFAKTITMETGKPIHDSKQELSFTIEECQYFADHLEEFLEPETVKTKAKKSYVLVQPLGPIFQITAYSYPFLLLFRSAVGALAMGNTVINRNTSSCPQCGVNAESVFKEAGFTNGEFLNLIVDASKSELIIKNKRIRGVSFTGSAEKGVKIAALAGQYTKKSVMEFGGNDAFLVCPNADLDKALEQGIERRLLNSGQCRVAAKRFIVDEKIYEDFKNRLVDRVKQVKVGDPMDEDTRVGPLAKKSALEKIKDQVSRAKGKGGKILFGGEQPKDERLQKGLYYMPTVIEITEENPLFKEETFGPVFVLIRSRDERDAIRLANKSRYGLGCTIFSKDEKRAEQVATEIEAGFVMINRAYGYNTGTPVGGVKGSGYGREGGKQGAHEFVNFKTVWISE